MQNFILGHPLYRLISLGLGPFRGTTSRHGLFRTRWIGANPEKSDLLNFRGPDRRKFSELCVFAVFFLRKQEKKLTKCSQNPGLVKEFSATLRGQLNWTGPIANGSDLCPPSPVRKLEKAVAVGNSLPNGLSSKSRRCWKILPRFSGRCLRKSYRLSKVIAEIIQK